MRRLSSPAGLVALLFAGGCGLFPSLTDLGGGASCIGDQCGDAMSPVADAASAIDAPVPPLLADASPLDAAPIPFCASLSTKPLLCDDFDSVPLPGSFATSDISKGGALGLDVPDAGLGSRFLYASIIPGSSTDATAFLARSFPNVATKFSLTCSVRIAARTAGQGSDFARIVVNGDAGGVGPHHLILNYRGYLEVGEQFGPNLATYIGHAPSTSPKLGEWARISVTIDVAAHELEIMLNGASVLKEALHPSWIPATHRLTFGITYAQGAADGWRYDLDDVVYDAN